MNSNEFAKDFGCKLDSPMNPKSKCSVWTSPISLNKSVPDVQNKKENMTEQINKESMMTHQNITNPAVHSLPTFIRNLIGPIG